MGNSETDDHIAIVAALLSMASVFGLITIFANFVNKNVSQDEASWSAIKAKGKKEYLAKAVVSALTLTVCGFAYLYISDGNTSSFGSVGVAIIIIGLGIIWIQKRLWDVREANLQGSPTTKPKDSK